jgi:hypothetical protein
MAISEWTFHSFSLSLKLYIYSETLKFYIHETQSENTGAARWSMKWVGFVANADICIGYELEMNNDR